MSFNMKVTPELLELTEECVRNSSIDPSLYGKYDVKRGLRDINGNGVLAGLTEISDIIAFKNVDGVKTPCDGELYYRGVNIVDLVRGFLSEGRLGFEETAYLLLFGKLPTEAQLGQFNEILKAQQSLPKNFVRDVVMKAPSRDMMNTLSRSVLTLYAYDHAADDTSLPNVLRQCLTLIAVFPMLSVYGFQAYNHYMMGKSLYIHNPSKKLSTAENILRMLRPDKQYTQTEALVLDLALVLHMEHGGANIKVVRMVNDMKKNVKDWTDEEEVSAYLRKLLHKEAFDRKGLIYGMGHAVYSISDPRATIFKAFVEKLAKEKHREKDYGLYSMVERLAPKIIGEERHIYKGVAANVDFYSGFVYSMLDLPLELFTPMFACARIVGWSAHRMEELINADKIIRPAYKNVKDHISYVSLKDRK